MSEQDTVWTVDRVTGFLDHEEPEVRTWALRWLKLHADTEVAGARAAEMLTDPESRVVATAVAVLVETGPRGHREALEACIGRDDLGKTTLGRGMMLLAAAGAEGARRAAAEGLSDEETGFPAFDWSIWARHAPESFADFLAEVYADSELPAEPKLLDACIATQDARLAGPVLGATLRVDTSDGDLMAGPEGARERLLDDLLANAAGAWPSLPEPEDLRWEDDESDFRHLPFPGDDEQDDLMGAYAERLRLALESDDADGFAECVAEYADTLVDEGVEADDNPEFAWGLALARALPESADAFESPEQRVRFAYGTHVGLTLAVGLHRALDEWEAFEDLLEIHSRSLGREKDRIERALTQRWGRADAETRERWKSHLRDWLVELDDPEARLQRLEVAAPLDGLRLDDALTDFVDRFRGSTFDLQALGPPAVKAFSRVLLDQRAWFSENARQLIEAGGGLSDAAQFALGKSNARWAAEVFEYEMNSILHEDIGGDVWQDVRRLGDPDLLELTLREWHPVQTALTRTAHLLAHLAERPEALPDEVLEDVEKFRSGDSTQALRNVLKRIQSDPGSLIRESPVPVLLRCRNCQRCYRYEVESITVDPKELRAHPGSVYESMRLDPKPICWHCDSEDFSPTSMTTALLMIGLERAMAHGLPLPADSLFQVELPDTQRDPSTGRPRRSKSSKTSNPATTYVAGAEPGRNEPCPCGSGRKYKHCCLGS